MTAATRTEDLYPTRIPGDPTPMTRHDPVVWGSAADGPFDADALNTFDANGFLTLDALLSADEIAFYRGELDRLAGDESVRSDERTVLEPGTGEVRSIFEVHRMSAEFAALVADPRLADRARQLLGSDVYIHQSRVNYMPGFTGRGFYWHSDFETWHAEDGLPRMRTVSMSIALTDNYPYNGGLMLMPGAHKTYVPCVGETPANHYKESLKEQEIGVPDRNSITALAHRHGIDQFTGPAGSALLFDCNSMHGSGSNITPFPRSNVFIVFNSVDNAAVEPFAAPQPRPSFIGARDFTPVG